MRCQAESERYYIQNVLRLPEAAASGFTLAAWEATPKYAKQMYSDVSVRGDAQIGTVPGRAGLGRAAGAGLWPGMQLAGRLSRAPCSAGLEPRWLLGAGHALAANSSLGAGAAEPGTTPATSALFSLRADSSKGRPLTCDMCAGAAQAMSYCGHMNKIETDSGMVACLDWRFGLSAADGSAYERTQPSKSEAACVLPANPAHPDHSDPLPLPTVLKNYTVPVSRWLREYPASQVHVIQYEELIDGEHEVAVLQRLTDFLGARDDQSLRWCACDDFPERRDLTAHAVLTPRRPGAAAAVPGGEEHPLDSQVLEGGSAAAGRLPRLRPGRRAEVRRRAHYGPLA